MPPDSPSSLADEDYINMVALILQKNGFPAGNETLSASKLDGILIVGKDGPKEVPNFRLVEVVGCLTHGPNDAWTLTRTSTPAVANERPRRLNTEGEAFRSHSAWRRSAGECQHVRPGCARRAEVWRRAALPGAGQGPHQLVSLETVDPNC